ncbi:hypothetical protein [Tropicimonas sp. IMCC34043]|uniref:hypothetical protein n=1 Tax=Tropicimonas sp. IMCC34043 TaxID=2248760 RepID=UPI000E2740D9|nr:hypothetical protein [Tropicimonas sp. IMCC34043]
MDPDPLPFGPRRQISTLAALVVAAATPATLALSYYHLTGDPAFRPLALTVDRLADFGQVTDGVVIRAVIRFDATENSKAAALTFAQLVHGSFYAKGIEARVSILPVPGSGPPTVTFQVANGRYGPFPASTAATGIESALQAFHLAEGWYAERTAE